MPAGGKLLTRWRTPAVRRLGLRRRRHLRPVPGAVLEGGGAMLPTEASLINKREAREHVRLSCQVAVKQDMRSRCRTRSSASKVECTVRSNHNVATFIKELVLELPEGEDVDFRAGGYVQIECPPHDVQYRDFDIETQYRDEWDRYDLWRYGRRARNRCMRAYSMANYPEERASSCSTCASRRRRRVRGRCRRASCRRTSLA